MMPIKQMLESKPLIPGPPVLVIDETTIATTTDAGPICQCHERFCAVEKYTSFVPGGVNPYKRRKIPNGECFEVTWQKVRLGSSEYGFERPIAIHKSQMPENFVPSQPEGLDVTPMLGLPLFTEDYYQQKLLQCNREHVKGCKCPI